MHDQLKTKTILPITKVFLNSIRKQVWLNRIKQSKILNKKILNKASRCNNKRIDKRDRKQQKSDWYQKNRNDISLKNNIKVTCECG